MTVQHGGRRVGGARSVDEDGGDRAAVASGAVDAKKEHHAGNGAHGIGHRQKEDDAEDHAEAGNGGEDAADEYAQVDPEDVLQGEEQPGGRADKVKQSHVSPP